MIKAKFSDHFFSFRLMALLHLRILVRQGDHFLICRSEGDFHFVPFLDQFDTPIVVSFGPAASILNDQAGTACVPSGGGSDQRVISILFPFLTSLTCEL